MLKPEWVIIWITIAYTLVSAIALFLLGVQIHQSRMSTQRQLRAYVVPESFYINNVANPDPSLTTPEKLGDARIQNDAIGPLATVYIKNTGQTPSYDVTHSVNIYSRPHPLSSPLEPIESGKKSVIIMGPQVTANLVIHLNHPLPDIEKESMKHGYWAIYLEGVITYTDIFEKKHTTHYRVMHQPFGRLGISTELAFCPEGNHGD